MHFLPRSASTNVCCKSKPRKWTSSPWQRTKKTLAKAWRSASLRSHSPSSFSLSAVGRLMRLSLWLGHLETGKRSLYGGCKQGGARPPRLANVTCHYASQTPAIVFIWGCTPRAFMHSSLWLGLLETSERLLHGGSRPPWLDWPTKWPASQTTTKRLVTFFYKTKSENRISCVAYKYFTMHLEGGKVSR